MMTMMIKKHTLYNQDTLAWDDGVKVMVVKDL